MRYLGCAYYPEYWGEARVEEDARLMKAAAVNCCRIGEFAWSRMEEREERFTLSWLHHAVKTLGKSGINVLLCTPTATPPFWLTSAYPDVLMVKKDGRRAVHDNRRHYCTTSDTYRRHTARVVEKLATEFRGYKNVIGWQIDNELGPENGWCHCENCQGRFQRWLQERYGTIKNLDAKWKTGFWSLDYSDWRQVRLSDDSWGSYSARVLDSRRFWSDMMIEYGLFQAKMLKELHPGAVVTTNGMGPMYNPIDYYKLYGALDVAADDLYYDCATQDANVAAMGCHRAYRPGEAFWITETGSGALSPGKSPTPGQFRAWFYSALAHGCDSYLVFRWRTCLSGQEQELQGMLEHSGRPRHRYQHVKACFKEYRQIEKQMGKLPLPDAPVAIVTSYDTMWAYDASRVGREVGYSKQILKLHEALYDRNIVADVVSHTQELSAYKLLILPSLMIVDAKFAARLEQFVRGGGVVLATGQLGMRDQYDGYLDERGPDHLQKLFGCYIEGSMYLYSHVGPDQGLHTPQGEIKSLLHVPVAGQLGEREISGHASVWIADIALAGGKAKASFGSEAYAGQPAVVEKTSGKGRTIYLGAIALDEGSFSAVVDYAIDAAGMKAGPKSPRYVEVVRRGEVVFVVNHTSEPVEVRLDEPGTAIVGSYVDGVAVVPAQDVCIVKRG